MSRVKGQTSPEEMEEAVARLVDSPEVLAEVSTRQSWLDYLEKTIGTRSTSTNEGIAFWLQTTAVAEDRLGVHVVMSEKTGQVTFRVPAGQTGAGQFMSKDDVSSRIMTFRAMMGQSR